MTPQTGLRAVYLADTLADVRHLEGLSSRFHVTFVTPTFLGDRQTNYWPPRAPATVRRVVLRGGRIGFMLRAARWLRRHRHEQDVVFVLDNLTAALAATAARRIGGPPIVLQVGRPTLDYVHCKAAVEPRWRNLLRRGAAGLLVALNERSADGIGAVSEYCAEQCRRHNDHTIAIPWYGVDTEVFAPRWTRDEARDRLGLPQDQPIVMLRSRIAPEKDPETYLRAIGRLREQGRRVCAVYMGGEYAELAALADRLGVEVVSRKPADMTEIPLWYVAADVDVQTSRAEGLGVSPLEALACGTPVVVSDVGGLPEVVDGGRAGQLVPVGDHDALAAAIARLLDDPSLAAAFRDRGLAWVRERYTSEAAFERWAELGTAAAGRQPRGDVASGPRPRILFVDHEVRLSGGELDLVDLVRGLGDRVESHVVLPGEGTLATALRAEGATVHFAHLSDRLRRVSRWDLAARPWPSAAHAADAVRGVVALRRLIRHVAPDAVHTNSMKAHLLALAASGSLGIPVVWHVRDILEDGWLRRAFATAARVGPARVICISHATAEPFRGTAAEARVRVVHNGVRPRVPAATAVAEWRARLAPGGQVLIGIVGQLASWKGQDVFIEAAAELSDAADEFRFVIAGECLFPENESAYVRALERRVEDLGLDGRLQFVGHVDPVEPLMTACDVLVHASRLPEPFGRVVVESMALGTPVVTTTIGAGPELVPPDAGRLVPPDDPAALAVAVRELTTPDVLDRAAGAARTAARQFTIERTAAGVLDVWAELGITPVRPAG